MCVEGNPLAVDTLRENIRRNHGERSVKVFANPVDYSGRTTVALRVDEELLGSSITGASIIGEGAPAVTLSEIYRRSRFDRFALVCDIEGAEAGVFAREALTLARCDQMIVELHDTFYDGRHYQVADLRAAIEKLGFRFTAGRHNVCVYERGAA